LAFLGGGTKAVAATAAVVVVVVVVVAAAVLPPLLPPAMKAAPRMYWSSIWVVVFGGARGSDVCGLLKSAVRAEESPR
jgi:hypothetical protein